MSKTVREAAQELGVSRQTVYCWIKKAQSSGIVKLDSQSVKGSQALTVTDEQISAMKSAFQGADSQVNSQVNSQDDSQVNSQACQAVKDQIDSLTAQNAELADQLRAADDQIRALNDQLRAAGERISAADDRIRAQCEQISAQNDQIRQLITLTDQAQRLNAATARQLEDLRRQRRGLRSLIDKMRGIDAEAEDQR